MSPTVTAVLVGFAWVLAIAVFLAVVLCRAAAIGDDVGRRALGPASSDADPDPADDDFALSVASAIYDYGIYGRWHP